MKFPNIVFGPHKNRLIETVLFSSHNISCFGFNFLLCIIIYMYGPEHLLFY